MNKILSLVEQCQICYLSSVNEDGYPITRAMLKPVKYEDGVFYLHTNTSSKKVKQFLNNEKSCLYFCDQNSFKGVSFIGNVEVISDKRKAEFWKEDYKMHYSKGKGDFTVLKFIVLKGEMYSQLNVDIFDLEDLKN